MERRDARLHLGSRSAAVDAVGAARRYDLTIVAGAGIAWVQDGDRNSVEEREHQQRELIERLDELGAEHLVVEGRPRERIEVATRAVLESTGLTPPADGLEWLELGLAGGWRHLERREGGDETDRWLAGTSFGTAEVAAALDDGRIDYETAAAELGLDVAAVREADWHAARYVETREGAAWSAPYHGHSGPPRRAG